MLTLGHRSLCLGCLPQVSFDTMTRGMTATLLVCDHAEQASPEELLKVQ